MMELVDYLNKHRNPDNKTLSRMMTASKNVFRVVDLVLKNLEQTENKKAAATYLYQVDCDGEWGEIHFDFENKRVKIQKPAEWDTTKSHKYAWKVIGFISRKGTKVLPEKKRIILWDKRIGQQKKAVRLQNGRIILLPCSQ